MPPAMAAGARTDTPQHRCVVRLRLSGEGMLCRFALRQQLHQHCNCFMCCAFRALHPQTFPGAADGDEQLLGGQWGHDEDLLAAAGLPAPMPLDPVRA